MLPARLAGNSWAGSGAETAGQPSPSSRWSLRLFYFCIFQKKNLQKYIFGFRFYSSIPLPSGREAAGGLPLGRGAAGSLQGPPRK